MTLLVATTLVVAGCSASEESQVRGYNNEIVRVQQEMLKSASAVTEAFEGATLDMDIAVTHLEKVLEAVNGSYSKFQGLAVPKGAEELADSMKRFFETEIEGINGLIAALKDFEGKAKDPTALQGLMRALDQFTQNETAAFVDFDKTQKKVSARYGQQVQGN